MRSRSSSSGTKPFRPSDDSLIVIRIVRFFVALLSCALLGTSAFGSEQSDLIIYNHPVRPNNSSELTTVRALLLGYNPNRDHALISPYIVVKIEGREDISRVFLTDDMTIDGIPFHCPDQQKLEAEFGPVCKRLPRRIALLLPMMVEITVFDTRLPWIEHSLIGTIAMKQTEISRPLRR